jgi:zinc transporter ZupT
MFSLLLLSFVTLLAGPILFGIATKHSFALRFLDAFVLCSIFGLMAFHVLPESVSDGGFAALGAAFFGFASPILATRLLKTGHCKLHRSLLSVATIGIVAHAVLDGMALAGPSAAGSSPEALLGIAVVLHRLPEGVGVWRIAQSSMGRRAGILILIAIMLSTLAGFFFGESFLSHSSAQVLVYFEAFMAGVLLHMVFHRHSIDDSDSAMQQVSGKSQWFTGAGAFCGILLVIGLSAAPSAEHPHGDSPFDMQLDPTTKKDIICCP